MTTRTELHIPDPCAYEQEMTLVRLMLLDELRSRPDEPPAPLPPHRKADAEAAYQPPAQLPQPAAGHSLPGAPQLAFRAPDGVCEGQRPSLPQCPAAAFALPQPAAPPSCPRLPKQAAPLCRVPQGCGMLKTPKQIHAPAAPQLRFTPPKPHSGG